MPWNSAAEFAVREAEDSDSSISSDFGTPAKFPHEESSSRCCIDMNHTGYYPEKNWKSRVCTNIFDREGKVQIVKVFTHWKTCQKWRA